MSTFQASVTVMLKPVINDPEGITVGDALVNHIGYSTVRNTRVGKTVEFIFEAANKAEASRQVEDMCRKFLANPVTQYYRFTVKRVSKGK